MKINGLHISLLFTLTSVLAGCSSNEPEPAGGDSNAAVPLRFSVSTSASRAEATTQSLSEFSVWGLYRTTGAVQSAAWNPVFGDTPKAIVRKTAESLWSYGEELYYWYPGNSYTFLAFASATDNEGQEITPDLHTNANNNSHYLTLSDFDGTQGTDLLHAVDTRDYIDGTSSSSVVNLKFSHLTSRIIIAGLIDPVLPDNQTVTVTSISLHGMNSTGSWSGAAFNPASSSYGTWTVSNTTSATNPYANSSIQYTIQKSTNPVDLFKPDGTGIDIMMLPQPISPYSVIDITYFNNNETTTLHKVSLNLATASTQLTNGWEAGRTYRYTITFGGSDYITFAKPSVVDWEDLSGGNFIIQ